jgi:hypothetical protein
MRRDHGFHVEPCTAGSHSPIESRLVIGSQSLTDLEIGLQLTVEVGGLDRG